MQVIVHWVIVVCAIDITGAVIVSTGTSVRLQETTAVERYHRAERYCGNFELEVNVMASIAEAVGFMIGRQEISGEDIVYTTQDVVDIINAAIQLFEADDKEESVKKLQLLRYGVEEKNYSLDALTRWTGCCIEDEDDVHHEELKELRLLRFKQMYPVAYLEFDSERNRTYVTKCIEEFCKKFPVPPKSSIVYNSAKDYESVWENYVNRWETLGLKQGNAIAWAVDSEHTLHLLHFTDNIMDVGVKMESNVVDEIMVMREKNTYAFDAYDSVGNRISFSRNSDDYAIYVNNDLIMEIKPGMFMTVADTLRIKKVTPVESLTPFLDNLTHG